MTANGGDDKHSHMRKGRKRKTPAEGAAGVILGIAKPKASGSEQGERRALRDRVEQTLRVHCSQITPNFSYMSCHSVLAAVHKSVKYKETIHNVAANFPCCFQRGCANGLFCGFLSATKFFWMIQKIIMTRLQHPKAQAFWEVEN
ncbi:hypothetical protein [Iodidimonas muriae]|uniref:hypothetical protein n=1 Tax=Iodidimonas muriae TaxID=261467 RepID=UPI0012311FA0|nr:hypothetical protein [Iodidimonas muriae]